MLHSTFGFGGYDGRYETLRKKEMLENRPRVKESKEMDHDEENKQVNTTPSQTVSTKCHRQTLTAISACSRPSLGHQGHENFL